jgi:hypothetical protein
MTAFTNRLRKLHEKAVERGQWPLACALTSALADAAHVDNHINVIGAMHEAGLLRNSLEPLWTTWRSEPDAGTWLRRCLERLVASDTDYWALSGLLGTYIPALRKGLTGIGFQLLSIRLAQSPKDGDAHIATYCLKHSDRIISAVLEIGWNPSSGEVVDTSRWRAVILDRQSTQDGNLIGEGSGSYFMRARLPYGSWRILHSEFSLRSESVVSRDQTMLKGEP